MMEAFATKLNDPSDCSIVAIMYERSLDVSRSKKLEVFKSNRPHIHENGTVLRELRIYYHSKENEQLNL